MSKETPKLYYTVRELQPSIDDLYEKGIVRGKDVGFSCLYDLYTVKLGCTTYFMGSPTSGKSEFLFECLINLSEFYGWKHAIYTPETGTKDEIVAELCSKYLRKPFYKNYAGHMSDNERYQAMAWLNEHFYIIDPAEKDLSVTGFYNQVEKIELDLNIKIHTTTIDPYNELKHDMDTMRQDLYIETMLGNCRKNAMKNNRHNFILTHCADQKPVTNQGITYYPPPTAREYAGGQAWYRKGLAMIGVWRPPAGLEDDYGVKHVENEVHIIIHKSKPKGIGRKGTAKLFFDIKRNRYYERTQSGVDRYASADGLIAKEEIITTTEQPFESAF